MNCTETIYICWIQSLRLDRRFPSRIWMYILPQRETLFGYSNSDDYGAFSDVLVRALLAGFMTNNFIKFPQAMTRGGDS